MKYLFKGIGLLFVVYFAISFIYSREINTPLNNNGADVDFVITSGESVENISASLEREGVIKSKFFFKVYAWREKLESDLKAGEYVLSPSLSIRQIAKTLVNGEIKNREKVIKIIEGWDLDEIGEYLEKNNIVLKNDFFKLVKGTDEALASSGLLKDYDFLYSKPKDASLEGYLFPDTYRIFKDSSAEDIVRKMLDNFDAKINSELRKDIEKSGQSIHNIVTMASIVEKEVAEDNDKPIVSGILYKRMNIGMRLEVDSTINYITGNNDPSAKYADLKIDSPYNTYLNYGLPPGPIACPGLSSIKAAIYPENSPYLFYLNRQDTKETIFSRDYDEHLRNKNKYLK